MNTTAQCSGEANISHDMRIAVFGTCSACGGSHVLPRPVMPATVRSATLAPQPVRVDAVKATGPNTWAVTYPTGDADHELYTMRLLVGPGIGI